MERTPRSSNKTTGIGLPTRLETGGRVWQIKLKFPGLFNVCILMSFRLERCIYKTIIGGHVVRLTVRDRESIQEAVRRFRKLVERSGIKKEMRRREYYEKPSEVKRRARLRAERRNRRNRLMGITR